MRLLWLARAGACALVAGLAAAAQAQTSGTITPVDAATRAAVVKRLEVELQNRYVFPAKVPAVDRALNGSLQADRSERVDGDAFAKALTDDVYAVLHDKHVRVRFSATAIPQRSDDAQPTADEVRQMREQLAQGNYGFQRVQRLRGNVGYIDLRGFAPADGAGPVLAAAMQFVNHTSSLIIDLRHNGGGEPETVSLLCSYLMSPDERVHVNDLAMRAGGSEVLEQFWTSRVPGPYYLDRPVYLLVGPRTFSGAEEFAYDLKNLHRATLVGETTGGGANPGDFVRLDAHFDAFIPNGRAISPVTHTNWEGVGVKPDVASTVDDALKVAYLAAIQQQLASTTDADRKAALGEFIAEVDKTPPDRVLDM
jgi:retinol-binding protein 3